MFKFSPSIYDAQKEMLQMVVINSFPSHEDKWHEKHRDQLCSVKLKRNQSEKFGEASTIKSAIEQLSQPYKGKKRTSKCHSKKGAGSEHRL